MGTQSREGGRGDPTLTNIGQKALALLACGDPMGSNIEAGWKEETHVERINQKIYAERRTS